jgi:hypothetical protein
LAERSIGVDGPVSIDRLEGVKQCEVFRICLYDIQVAGDDGTVLSICVVGVADSCDGVVVTAILADAIIEDFGSVWGNGWIAVVAVTIVPE